MAVDGGQVSVMRNPGKYPQTLSFSSMRDPPSSSQWQAAGSPGEHPEKGDGLEVWVSLPVAAGPECTQNKIIQVKQLLGFL